jgi:hypothetical protein
MAEPQIPTSTLLEDWLEDVRLENYLCNHCEGLHINALQDLEGVVNSRIFLQEWGLLFSTELEIRPMALLPLAADLGRLNMDYPTLKVFLDIVDDATPQLVVAANMLTGAGLTLEQFTEFVVTTMEGTGQLAAECLSLDYLFEEGGQPQFSGSRSLH